MTSRLPVLLLFAFLYLFV